MTDRLTEKGRQVLEKALQMEIDGLRFFTEKKETVNNSLGKKIFDSLAADEVRHQRIIEKIMAENFGDEVKNVGDSAEAKERFENVFSNVGKEIEEQIEADPDDIAALDVGIEIELRSYNFYMSSAGQSDTDEEKELYERLAKEENGHFQMLWNTKEYLSSPAMWQAWDDGPMLDGG